MGEHCTCMPATDCVGSIRTQLIGPAAILQVVDDLRKQLAEELDFRREADNSRALAAAMRDNPIIAVPALHDTLSNQRIITMEWVSGAKVRAAASRFFACIDEMPVSNSTCTQ
jgi:predicted unusual protein kinase regulating ubiquinone biosynthesis (AarF/ABC1/UbiB family)